MQDIIQEIVGIAKGIGLVFDTNEITWDRGERQTTIGIPTRTENKRKILRGFFWVRPKSGKLNFWLPQNAAFSVLSKRYGIEIVTAPVTHMTGGKKDSILAMTDLSRLNLTSQKHRQFIRDVIEMNREGQ